MKFIITRLSQAPADYATEKPCDEAMADSINITQSIPTKELKNWRFKDAIEKFDPIGESIWYGIGTNHRIENGIAKRDFSGCAAWSVDLDAQGIKTFIDKYKSVLITDEGSTVHGLPEIKIMDGRLF